MCLFAFLQRQGGRRETGGEEGVVGTVRGNTETERLTRRLTCCEQQGLLGQVSDVMVMVMRWV